MQDNRYICPVCSSNELSAKYEASYIYSYVLDTDAPGLRNKEEFLPFLYDKREQKEARQYIECNTCKSQFPCFFTEGNKGIEAKVLQKAFNLSE